MPWPLPVIWAALFALAVSDQKSNDDRVREVVRLLLSYGNHAASAALKDEVVNDLAERLGELLSKSQVGMNPRPEPMRVSEEKGKTVKLLGRRSPPLMEFKVAEDVKEKPKEPIAQLTTSVISNRERTKEANEVHGSKTTTSSPTTKVNAKVLLSRLASLRQLLYPDDLRPEDFMADARGAIGGSEGISDFPSHFDDIHQDAFHPLPLSPDPAPLPGPWGPAEPEGIEQGDVPPANPSPEQKKDWTWQVPGGGGWSSTPVPAKKGPSVVQPYPVPDVTDVRAPVGPALEEAPSRHLSEVDRLPNGPGALLLQHPPSHGLQSDSISLVPAGRPLHNEDPVSSIGGFPIRPGGSMETVGADEEHIRQPRDSKGNMANHRPPKESPTSKANDQVVEAKLDVLLSELRALREELKAAPSPTDVHPLFYRSSNSSSKGLLSRSTSATEPPMDEVVSDDWDLVAKYLTWLMDVVFAGIASKIRQGKGIVGKSQSKNDPSV